jgi:ABC-type molybdate transport system substrate-binding protein
MTPVLQELARAYQATHPHVLVEVRGGGSAVGLNELQDGQTDLAAVSWRPEGQKIPDGLQAVPIARDAIAIVMYPTQKLERSLVVRHAAKRSAVHCLPQNATPQTTLRGLLRTSFCPLEWRAAP